MMNRFFTDTQTLQRMYKGPLGPYMDAYAALLHEGGYLRDSACFQIRLVADLSRWLQRQGLAAEDVNPQSVDRYLRYRKQRLYPGRSDASACKKLLELLHKLGAIAGQTSNTRISASQRVVNNFKQYLSQERGLSPAGLANYVPVARQFLSERFGQGRVQFTKLRAADITGFVQRHAHDFSPATARLMVTGLRAFLRYLRYQGEIAIDLAACVPSVASWKFAALPKFIAPDQVERVLQHCDRQTPLGRRDYAILLLLARLALCAGEVVALKLEDIDWETGQITVRGKGGRRTRLPLPQEVGEALVAYLQKGRPTCSTRGVFVRQRAPRRGFANPTVICTIVARALRRAGVDAPHKGGHLFRHSLATRMLGQGASLAEIGEWLRHQSPQTTTIYAKVDLTALRMLALAWPGGAR